MLVEDLFIFIDYIAKAYVLKVSKISISTILLFRPYYILSMASCKIAVSLVRLQMEILQSCTNPSISDAVNPKREETWMLMERHFQIYYSF